MKKTVIAALVLIMIFSLCACGDNNAEQQRPERTPAYDKLYFASGDVKFGVFDYADTVMEALGEPQGTFEADSCAYQGKDYFYYYDGFELTVNEIDGYMLITGISVVDDTVETPQGLKIGMPIEDALSELSLESEQSGSVYRFYDVDTVLLMNVGDDGAVSAIEYLPKENAA